MTANERVFVGDIQGCADELDALLDEIGFDPQRQSLFAVGDLVNRGPDSARVLRRMIELDAESVLGNHDLHLLARAAGAPARPRDTLDGVLGAADAQRLLHWLRHRPLVRGWDDLLLVHAGLHPAWDDPEGVARPLESEIQANRIPDRNPGLQFLTRVRHCNADGERPENEEEAGQGFQPWDRFYCGDRIVVFGHWSQRGRVEGAKVRGLDTGCVWGGELTAWIAEEDRFVAVPARRRYCDFD